MNFGTIDLFRQAADGRQVRTLVPGDPQYNLMHQVYNIVRSGFFMQDLLAGRGEPLPYLNINDDFIGTMFSTGFNPAISVLSFSAAIVVYNDIVLATCFLLKKPSSTAENSYAYEIWSLVSNPYYLRSGAVKFLIYNTFIHCRDNGGQNNQVILELARDSYPYISFYDRFLLYAKLGFTPTLPHAYVNVLSTYAGQHRFDLFNVDFVADIHNGVDEPSVIDKTTNERMTLERWQELIPFMYPTEQRIAMYANIANINWDAINAKIHALLNPVPPRIISPVNTYTPNQCYGFVSHSEYVTGHTSATFRTYTLPPNVELIIINSPGYVTHGLQVQKNWNFNDTYLQYLPIQILKNFFPGFKSDARGNIPTPHMNCDSGVAFIKATSGSIMFEFPELNNKIQIHCYHPGDVYPNLNLSANIGINTNDFVGGMYGLYRLNQGILGQQNNIWQNHPGQLDAMHIQNDAINAIIAATGFPDITTRISPEPLEFTNNINNGRLTQSQLSDIINHINTVVRAERGVGHENDLLRLTIFSCGIIINDELNRQMQDVSVYNLGQHVHVENIAEIYPRMLAAVGQGIFESLGFHRAVPAAGGGRKRRHTYKNKRKMRKTSRVKRRKQTR